MEDNLKRLNKFIGETGYCSRREADKLIDEGRVTLNGVVPELGTKVSPDDEVSIDGKLIKAGKYSSTKTIEVQALPKGVYFLKVSNQNLKFIKE